MRSYDASVLARPCLSTGRPLRRARLHGRSLSGRGGLCPRCLLSPRWPRPASPGALCTPRGGPPLVGVRSTRRLCVCVCVRHWIWGRVYVGAVHHTPKRTHLAPGGKWDTVAVSTRGHDWGSGSNTEHHCQQAASPQDVVPPPFQKHIVHSLWPDQQAPSDPSVYIAFLNVGAAHAAAWIAETEVPRRRTLAEALVGRAETQSWGQSLQPWILLQAPSLELGSPILNWNDSANEEEGQI